MNKFYAKGALAALIAACICFLTACGETPGHVSGTETEPVSAGAPVLQTEQAESETSSSEETQTVRIRSRRDMLQASLEQRSALLAICRDLYGQDFTFARRIPEDLLRQFSERTLKQAASVFRPYEQVPEASEQDTASPLESLQADITGMIGSYSGVWSVYVCDLASGEDFVIHDKPMKSASVMKLFVMGAVYQAIEEGRLEHSAQVMELMEKMICYSSNEATNDLLAMLGNGSYREGIRRVNDFIASEGYGLRNHEYNGFQDSATFFDTEHNNLVTARACGLLLQRIYHRTFGSWSVCNEIENLMLAQDTRYKIPAGVERCADGVRIGNKTGELDSAENDAAVVYSPGGDYILCIFSADWDSKNEALTRIQDISETVYRYFNG